MYIVVDVLFIAGDHVPVIPLFEVVGKADKVDPEQIVATCVNVGASFGVTSIVIVAGVAHWPNAGIKVYTVVEVLLIAGAQIPVIPLFDIVGNAGKVDPEQIAATCVNVGIVFGFTITVIIAVVAHWLDVGKKVYVVVNVLFIAGDQVPIILLLEVVGNTIKLAPEQIGATWVNDGTEFGVTVIVIDDVAAHWPIVGVKL